jgi:hypothetical protein
MNPVAQGQHVWPALVWWGLLTATILFVPAYPMGFLDGIPADHLLDFVAAIAAAALIVSRDFSNVSRRQSACLLALLVLCAGLRVSSHWTYGGHSLIARYETALGSGKLQLQRSTRCSLPGASHLDENVDFDGIRIGFGRHPLWTDFLNSLGSRSEKNLDPLATPLRVHWTGFIHPSRDCALAVESNSAAALLEGQGRLRAGRQYPLSIQVSFPNLEHPHIRLLTQDDQLPVPADWLSPDERAAGSTSIAALLGIASWGVAAAWVYFLFRFSQLPVRARSFAITGECLILLIAVASGAILWELNSARDAGFAILPPDDYLLYENEARGLAANGFCQDDGVSFHRSPAMRYYLAAAHALFGESGYGVILFQQLLRGATGILVLHLMRRLAAPAWTGWAAAGIVILLPGPLTLSLRYWPETPGALLLVGVCLALVREERTKRGASSICTGLLCGLLALVRTNAVSLVPAIVVWTLFRGRGWRSALTFLSSAIGVLCFVPLRNYAVTGQWMLTPTEGAVTMVLGNNVPRDTNIGWAFTGSPGHDELLRQGMEKLWEFDHNRLASYDPFSPEDNARMAPALVRVWLAYVAQHPGHFLTQLLARVWHWFLPGWHVASVLSVLALAGFGFLVRGKGNRAWWTVWMATAAYSAPFWIAYFEPRHRAVILPELTALALFGVGCWMPAFGGIWQKLLAHVEHRDVRTDLPHLPGQVAANLRKRFHGEDARSRLLRDGERSVPDEFLDGRHKPGAHAQTAESHAE